jgi:hypothetical protein
MKNLTLFAAFVASLAMLSATVSAAPYVDRRCSTTSIMPELTIGEIEINLEDPIPNIVIYGSNFDNGVAPSVVIGAGPVPLLVLASDPNFITADVTGLLDGDYKIEVFTGICPWHIDTFDVTLLSLPDGEDPNNELITGGILNGTTLEITDAGGTTAIDLSGLVNDDTELTEGTGIDLTPDTITSTGAIAIDTAIVPRLNVANTFTEPQTFKVSTGIEPGITGWNSYTSGSSSRYGVYGRSDANIDYSTGVYGHTTASSGKTYGGQFYSASSAGIGVYGDAPLYGVKGESGTGGAGVYGQAPTIGINYGVKGISGSDSGFGGYFQNTNSGGKALAAADYLGVEVFTVRADGLVGIGQTIPTAKLDVAGTVKATSFIGSGSALTDVVHLSGTNNFLGAVTATLFTGPALAGTSSAGTAVEGTSSGNGGKGVAGLASAAVGSGFGGHFESEGSNGFGVYGLASHVSGANFGVFGETNSASGYAGYFAGRVNVTGELTAGTKTFKIDHPLDPANQYLYHSVVESPDMMNVYNGNVVLDESGKAWIELPDYFDTLNKDFRYQLTCIGGFAPVYVAEEIHDNQFGIAGGQPGMKVSWQVTGIRQDPYAEAHRVEVEEDKLGDERGLYLHPKEYGQPEEMGIDYAKRPPEIPE